MQKCSSTHRLAMRKPRPDRPPAAAPLPAARDDLRGQRAGRLDGDHRPLGAGLRPHRQRPGDRRAVPRNPLPAGPAGAAPGHPGRAAAAAIRAAGHLLRRGGGLRRRWPCSPTTSRWPAVIVAGDDRRRPGADRPRADPRGGRGAAGADRRAARRQRPAQRRLHRRRRGRARRWPAWSSPASASRRRCCSTPPPSTLIAWILLTAGAAAAGRARTGADARPGPRRPRLHPREGDAAAAAGRPGRRLRLLRRGDPDRGRLRQGDARRQRLRLRPDARQLGSRDGPRQLRLRRRCGGRSLPLLLFFSTLAVGAGYLGLAAAPTLAVACAASVLGGAGNGVQWVSAISAVQELTAPGCRRG